jgi:hypothetical protein
MKDIIYENVNKTINIGILELYYIFSIDVKY